MVWVYVKVSQIITVVLINFFKKSSFGWSWRQIDNTIKNFGWFLKQRLINEIKILVLRTPDQMNNTHKKLKNLKKRLVNTEVSIKNDVSICYGSQRITRVLIKLFERKRLDAPGDWSRATAHKEILINRLENAKVGVKCGEYMLRFPNLLWSSS